jgi:hypothetical protein
MERFSAFIRTESPGAASGLSTCRAPEFSAANANDAQKTIIATIESLFTYRNPPVLKIMTINAFCMPYNNSRIKYF